LLPQSHIEWTYGDSAIYGHAVRNDAGDLSLYDWWLTSAGPLPTGGGAMVAKDRPAGLGPRLRDGTYLFSRGERYAEKIDRAGFVVPSLGFGTSTLNLRDGSYAIGVNGESVESGQVILQKPNAVIFDPDRAPCGIGIPLSPVTYEWTATGETVAWEKVHGNSCAGPQPATGVPWTRGPQGVIAMSQAGTISVADPGGFVTDEVVGRDQSNPNEDPDWSPDGSSIVFAGADQGGLDLFSVDSSGGGRVRLTHEAGDETAPSWSPDGGPIAYSFDDGLDVNWTSGIAVIAPDGTGHRVLTSRQEQSFVRPLWSPDGTRIAFTVLEGAQANAPNAYVMNADGSGLVELSSGLAAVLSWTRDGRIVLSSGGNLVTVLPDGSDERILSADPVEFGQLTMDWSPDGRWVTMASAGPSEENEHLYLMRGDASELFLVGVGTTPSWRPETP
jgi:hypothetical protein